MTEHKFNEQKLCFSISTGYVGSKRKEEVLLSEYIDYDEWINASESEREDLLDGFLTEWLANNTESGVWLK